MGVVNVFVFNMDEAGIGRRGLPKFSEILRRPRGEAEVNDCIVLNRLLDASGLCYYKCREPVNLSHGQLGKFA